MRHQNRPNRQKTTSSHIGHNPNGGRIVPQREVNDLAGVKLAPVFFCDFVIQSVKQIPIGRTVRKTGIGRTVRNT
jgi:hypothetical protein